MRRTLAAVVGLTLALAGVGPAVAGAAGPAATGPDGVASWSVPLDVGRGTTTTTVDAGTFTLAALSWDRSGPRPDHLELRVPEGAGWSEWFDLAVDESLAPDGRLATEPFIADGAARLQARVESSAPPVGLRVDLVHVADDVPQQRPAAALAPDEPLVGVAATPAGTTKSSATSARTTGTATSARTTGSATTGDEIRPDIVTRREWGANERGTTPVSSSTWLKAMYVHHTAGPNNYSQSRASAVVRSIWAFHTRSRGWPDIGYQFLVDRFGRIYEGRRGSIAGLPVGAQAGGYNASTIGVAVMGNHTSVTPSQRVLDAVVDVLAWQAHRYGVDPSGKARLRTARSTGSKTRWAYGKRTAALPVIRGHRDTNHTACPGARLYAKLPAIRRAVQRKVERAERRHGATPSQLQAPRVEPLRDRAHRVSVPAKVHLAWQAVPGARRYEILKRAAKHGKDPKQTEFAWLVESRTKRTRTTVKVPRGQTWTIAVRAVDELGRPGKVRVIGTTTRPVRAADLTRTGGWRTARNGKFFRGAAHVSRERGATLQVRGAKGVRAVWLVAATGPGRGKVVVSVGGKRVGKVSLARRDASPRELVELRLRPKRSGTVRIRAAGPRPVHISAVILERGRQ